ncbi:MAG: hypothetical protein ACLFRD_00695 [Nitriliruptoraceae bacterium]
MTQEVGRMRTNHRYVLALWLVAMLGLVVAACGEDGGTQPEADTDDAAEADTEDAAQADADADDEDGGDDAADQEAEEASEEDAQEGSDGVDTDVLRERIEAAEDITVSIRYEMEQEYELDEDLEGFEEEEPVEMLLAQDPPNFVTAMYLEDGTEQMRLIQDGESTTICEQYEGAWDCMRMDQDMSMARLGLGAFALLQEERDELGGFLGAGTSGEVAGRSAVCADLADLDADDLGVEEDELAEGSFCIDEELGVLLSSEWEFPDGYGRMEALEVSEDVDATLFDPPAEPEDMGDFSEGFGDGSDDLAPEDLEELGEDILEDLDAEDLEELEDLEGIEDLEDLEELEDVLGD